MQRVRPVVVLPHRVLEHLVEEGLVPLGELEVAVLHEGLQGLDAGVLVLDAVDLLDGVWQKVREELGELEVEIARNDQERMEEEFGDFMFAMINAARLYGINPENALEKTNKKFIRRFSYVEEKANENERRLSEMTLEEMDEYWNEAKRNETIEN